MLLKFKDIVGIGETNLDIVNDALSSALSTQKSTFGLTMFVFSLIYYLLDKVEIKDPNYN